MKRIVDNLILVLAFGASRLVGIANYKRQR